MKKNSFFKLNNINLYLILALLSVSFVMTFGNFFPTQPIIRNSYQFIGDDQTNWINEDPILKSKKYGSSAIGEEFVLSSHWGDQVAYMRMANHEKTIPPYQFRVLYPFIVSVVIDIEKTIFSKQIIFSKLDKYRLAQINYWGLNYFFLLLSMYVYYKILQFFTDNKLIIFTTIVLFTTQYSILNTASFSMPDIFSYFIFLCTFYCLINKNFISAAILLILSLLTKESFVIFTPALIAMSFESRDRRYFYLSIFPVLTFVLVRLYFGYSALNVQYNWDVAQGDIRFTYLLAHLGSMYGFLAQIIGMILAYGLFWLYIGKVNVLKEFNLKYFFLVFLVLLLIAELMLSSQISRVLSPISPVFSLIPVIFLTKENASAELNF